MTTGGDWSIKADGSMTQDGSSVEGTSGAVRFNRGSHSVWMTVDMDRHAVAFTVDGTATRVLSGLPSAVAVAARAELENDPAIEACAVDSFRPLKLPLQLRSPCTCG